MTETQSLARERAEQTAARIVEVLFTSGDKEVADRIALKQRIQPQPSMRRDAAAERDLGGWNRDAATRQVLAVLLACAMPSPCERRSTPEKE